MAEKFSYLYLFLLEGRPSVELPKKKGQTNVIMTLLVLAMGRMRLLSVGLGGIARCRSPPFFLIHFFSLVFRERLY